MAEQPPEPEVGPEVGSVGEEAAKLFGALSDWAREHQPAKDSSADGPAAAPSVGRAAAEALHSVDQHLARGDDCRYCPVCQVIHAVRETSPEVREHLATAAGSLLHAAAGLLATQVPTPRDKGERASGVERIDLDGDDQSDEDLRA